MTHDDSDNVARISRLSAEEWAAHDERVRAGRAREETEARRERWRATRKTLLEHGLSQRHLDMLADAAHATLDTPAVLALPSLSPTGISVLAGTVGAGKTYAAHCWLLQSWQRPDEWLARGLRMITAGEFAAQSRYKDKFQPLVKAKRLVLDELGAEYTDAKGSFSCDFDQLIDLRWRAKAPTVITTNLSMQDFRARYGERAFDRVRDDGEWIYCKRESLRGAGR